MKKVFHNQLVSENVDVCQIKKILIAELTKIHEYTSLRDWEIQYVISENILAAEFSLTGVSIGTRVLWNKHWGIVSLGPLACPGICIGIDPVLTF